MEIVNGILTPTTDEVRKVDYSIKTSAHAIQVLSKSLYSDPITSIVRELLCNALDSHLQAGTSSPVKITLDRVRGASGYSSSLYFIVEDYGTGLAPVELETLYTTYFGSSKEQNGEATGSFGLGSKSPFAYTDTFWVTSYWYGTATKYEASLNNDERIPTFTKLSEELSSRENGLRVEFLVKPYEDHKFRDAVNYVAGYMPEGMISYNDRICETKKYRIKCVYGGIPEGYNNDHRVVMGNVAYRLDTLKLNVPASLKNVPCTLFVANKAISVTPSREELHYNKRTVDVLNETFNRFMEEVRAHITTLLAGKSVADMRKAYYSLSGLDSLCPSELEVEGNRLNVNGHYKSSVRFTQYQRTTRNHKTNVWKVRDTELNSFAVHMYDSKVYTYTESDKRVPSRIKYHLQTSVEPNLLLVSKENWSVFCMEQGITQEECSILSLPTPPVKKRVAGESRGSKAGTIFKYTGRYDKNMADSWVETIISEDDMEEEKFYYVTLDRFRPFVGERELSFRSLTRCLGFEMNIGAIYGVKKAAVEDLPDNWIPLEELAESMHYDALYQMNDGDEYSSEGLPGFITEACKAAPEGETLLHSIVEEVQTLNKNYNKIHAIEFFQHLHGKDITTTKQFHENDSKVADLIESAKKRYPLLRTIDGAYYFDIPRWDAYRRYLCLELGVPVTEAPTKE